MTQEELILSIKSLKHIKPRENWVVFTKSRILSHSNKDYEVIKTNSAFFLGNIFEVFFTRKLAYSLVAILLVAAGAYSLINITSFQNNKVELLASEAKLKNDFKILEEKSKYLMETIERDPEGVDMAIEATRVAVENIADSIKEEPSLAKTVALEVKNRTYLNVEGHDDLKEAENGMYKNIVWPLIAGLDPTTLTKNQQQSLEEIKNLYEQKEYAVSFEKFLMLYTGLKSENPSESQSYLEENGQQTDGKADAQKSENQIDNAVEGGGEQLLEKNENAENSQE